MSLRISVYLPMKGEPQFHNVILAGDLHSIELHNYQPLENNAFVISLPVPERSGLCSFANT